MKNIKQTHRNTQKHTEEKWALASSSVFKIEPQPTCLTDSSILGARQSQTICDSDHLLFAS